MKIVTGYGGSFDRDLDKWVLYSMPDAVPLGVVADDRVACDIVLSALREKLKTEQSAMET